MVTQELNDKITKNFNWKSFFRIVGSVFFIGLAASIGINSNGAIWVLALSFLIAGIGVALILME